MKRIIFALISLMIMGGTAFAETKYYVKGLGMLSSITDSDSPYSLGNGDNPFAPEETIFMLWRDDVGFALEGGLEWDNGFSAGIEFTYLDLQLRGFRMDGRIDSSDDPFLIKTLMLNGQYEYNTDTFVNPYVGLGLGVGWVDEAIDRDFSMQLKAGLSFEILENLNLITGYKYLDLPNVDEITRSYYFNSRFDLTIHNFEFGAKYSF